MSIKDSPKRLLVVGREVGPITRLIKNSIPKVSIGAVDLLGNEETRFYADWKFSIEKQTSNKTIFRPKHRSIIDLLFELAKVMLEDLEFDLLIPLSPFQTKPNYINQLSHDVNTLAPNNLILDKLKSPYSFLTKISNDFPEKKLFPVHFSVLHELTFNKFPVIFFTKDKTNSFLSKEQLDSKRISNEKGFLFPFFQIHCGVFFGSLNILNFLGLQTLSNPYDHEFFVNELERNALIPFSLPAGISQEYIISSLSKIIIQFGIVGLITIYFIIIKNCIIPIRCNALPDENFDLWENRTSQSLIQLFLSMNNNSNHITQSLNFAFKLPIYFHKPITVPSIPKSLANQRNLPKVISHPEYPLCTISSTNSLFSETFHLLQQKKKEILQILSIDV